MGKGTAGRVLSNETSGPLRASHIGPLASIGRGTTDAKSGLYGLTRTVCGVRFAPLVGPLPDGQPFRIGAAADVCPAAGRRGEWPYA